MKKTLLCLSFIAMAASIGCKSKAIKKIFNNAKDDSSLSSEASDANSIITYTNDLLKLFKGYNDAAKGTVADYENKQKSWQNPSSINLPGIDRLNFVWSVKNSAKKAFETPPSALNKDFKFFEDSVKKYLSLFKKFQENDSALKIYIKAEDFKDDKYARGNELINMQYGIYPQLTSLRTSISDKIEVVADAAEETAMKDSPILEESKAAKSDLHNFRMIVEKISAINVFTDADLAAVDKQYEDLNTSIGKNKAIDNKNLEKVQKTAAYNRFYVVMTEEMATLKTVIRNVHAAKNLNDQEYNKIQDSYDTGVNAYNNWVN